MKPALLNPPNGPAGSAIPPQLSAKNVTQGETGDTAGAGIVRGRKLQRFFERPPEDDRSSSLVDWTVLLTGVVMLALSVAPAVNVKAHMISDDALDRAAPEEDWHPS